jgi:transposase
MNGTTVLTATPPSLIFTLLQRTSVSVWAATDMRKGFNGLYGLVRDHLGCDPESGHVFLFTNARRNRLKLLVYDHSGLWICSKKLDGGRFRWPGADTSETKIVLSHEELAMLLGGIDLAETRRRKWYRKPLMEVSDKLRMPA